MAIKKQEFYEGAALHQLACAGVTVSIRYQAPFFRLNDHLFVYLKYSTRCRSPWGFIFSMVEQSILRQRGLEFEIVIGLICGDDRVAALTYQNFASVAAPRESAIHIVCHRRYNQHYQVNGPDGTLALQRVFR